VWCWLCCESCCPMLGFCIQCLWVCSLSFAILQMCLCVCGGGHMLCAYTKLTFRLHLALSPDPSLHHAWHTGCSVLTALLCGCSVVKLTFYLHQTPSWLWLVRILTCLHPTRVDTTVQLMPGFHCITNRGALSSQHLVRMLHRSTLLMASILACLYRTCPT